MESVISEPLHGHGPRLTLRHGWLPSAVDKAPANPGPRCLQRDAIRDHKQFPNAVLLTRAAAFMEEHLGEPLDRDTVARTAGLSGSHFSRLIREQTGRTFTDLMAQYRVDRAKTLLRRTDKSIIQIAMECGFDDQSYFTRVFKRRTGTTPRAYRGL